MLIDSTYFVGELNIPNKNQPPIQALLNDLIEQREPEYLQGLLGYGFYKEIKEAVESSSTDQKWIDLFSGTEYTVNSKTRFWPGLASEDSISPVACYVYLYYLEKTETITMGVGEVKPDAENSSVGWAVKKKVRAWNQMVDINHSLICYLEARSDVYGDFEVTNHELLRKRNMWGI